MILFIYIFIILIFLISQREGFTLTLQKYDSFFNRHKIIHDKQTKVLTYEKRNVSYKKMNPSSIRNKSVVKKILLDQGIPTPPYYLWNKDITKDENLNKILFLNRPLVVKPDIGSKGLHVFTNLINDDDILEKVNEILSMNKKVLIEEQIQECKEYRIMVLNDSIIGVTEKKSAFIIGDGTHSLIELINKYNESIPSYYQIYNINYDYIQQQGYQSHDIVPNGLRVQLTNVANMSNGSNLYNIDINSIHPSNMMLFKHINHVLGYKVSGIDYMGDVTIPYQLLGSVIEVNSNPGIGPHYTVTPNKNKLLSFIVNKLFNS